MNGLWAHWHPCAPFAADDETSSTWACTPPPCAGNGRAAKLNIDLIISPRPRQTWCFPRLLHLAAQAGAPTAAPRSTMQAVCSGFGGMLVGG